MDTDVKTQKWTKGSEIAARDLLLATRMAAVRSGAYLEGDSAYVPDGQVRLAAIVISRETHDQELYTLLRQIMNDLPAKRDWLDPDVERAAKALLSTLEGKI